MLLESLPDSLVAAVETRDAARRRMASSAMALEFLVSDVLRWVPGSTVRVAFLDGDDALHADIAAATEQVTHACNLNLDFGVDAAGRHRRWTEADTEHQAEIRVSFDLPGYWSLVGTDSNDETIGGPSDPVGGGPGQRSLNLGGFKTDRPPDWRGTVRHEFMHALGFKHSHQNLRGPCESEFRWEDDPGYVPTRDPRGEYVEDAAGRRPGVYTFLAGEPNQWSRAKVDHNLRMDASADTVAGPFDRESVMLYRFDAFFYKTDPSPCTPTTDGIDLSEGDKRGLRLMYPETAQELSAIAERAGAALGELTAAPRGGLERLPQPRSPYHERAAALAEAMARIG